jgi:hypothetical protein
MALFDMRAAIGTLKPAKSEVRKPRNLEALSFGIAKPDGREA